MTAWFYRQLSGEWHDIAGTISYMLATVTAIRLGWLRRGGSQWLPDDQAVPTVFTAVATPVIAIVFAIEYRFLASPLQSATVAAIAAASLLGCLVGLFSTSYLLKRFGYPFKRKSLIFRREVYGLKLGGTRLTLEAEDIVQRKKISWATAFMEADYDIYLTFTQESMAMIHTVVQFTYLLFAVFGPLAVANAGLLLSGSKGPS